MNNFDEKCDNDGRKVMGKKIRLAVFGQKRWSREGGVEIVVKELCTRMVQQGCQVTRLKEARLNELEQFENFSFVKGNLADKSVIEAIFEQYKPEIVVNLGAQAGVRYSITNPDAYVEANLIGFYNILEACRHSYDEGHTPVEHLVYASSSSVYGSNKKVPYSTDHVFNGQGEGPWDPDCKDYAPLNVYGQTKLEGELAVSRILEKYFIVCIAWVFGLNGKNFIKTMLSVGKTHDSVRVVNDQIGTPTYTYDLARLLIDMNETEEYGYYHATNEGGYISWYDFTILEVRARKDICWRMARSLI